MKLGHLLRRSSQASAPGATIAHLCQEYMDPSVGGVLRGTWGNVAIPNEVTRWG